MNGFSYENQSTITYLVYSMAKEDAVDSMSLGMLTNNKIAGLAPAIVLSDIMFPQKSQQNSF